MSVAWVGVGVAAAGALSQASAAGDAADAQGDAAAASNATQRYMYDNNVRLNQPVVDTGNAARDRLSYLLGLSPTGFSGGGGAPQAQSYDQMRNSLLAQYTSSGALQPASAGPQFGNFDEAYQALGLQGAKQWQTQQERSRLGLNEFSNQPGMGPGYWQPGQPNGSEPGQATWVSTAGGGQASTVDEAGLNAEIQRRMAEQEQQRQAAITAAQSDPNYGRLAQQFQFDTYTPEKYQQAPAFSYTGEDLYRDPSYQFRLQQGQKALDRMGSAAGRFLSGRQLQASSDYNQGAASQEFQGAYGRALGTFNTNEANRFNTFSTNETNRFNAFGLNQGNRFNAHQANFSNSVNPLLALSGAGQVSAQYLGNSGQQTAALIGQTNQSNANAQGAAGIAQANAIGNGLSGAVNGYQQNQLLQQFMNRGAGVNNNPSGYSGLFQPSPINTYG